MTNKFPQGFVWGSGTAAFQIEGALAADGRKPSIWDSFSAEPGRIADGSNASIASDHYHRWREDVALMSQMGLDAYRFSIAWPRVMPEGTGTLNKPGLDFYERLVDELLAHNIAPWVTLFHWDLPLSLQQKGGWAKRDLAHHFADYSEAVVARLGDRVKHWVTLNEPNIFATNGHLTGIHAPGIRNFDTHLAVIHHQLLGHGLAAERIRQHCPLAQIGYAMHMGCFAGVENDEAHQTLCIRADDFFHGAYLEPVFNRRYPEQVAAAMDAAGVEIAPGDMNTIAQPMDFLGVNHYTRYWLRANTDAFGGMDTLLLPEQSEAAVTGMGWEIYPQGFTQVLQDLWARYQLPIVITENGASFDDSVSQGEVNDQPRVDFLRQYIGALHAAMATGVDVRGYFLWTLLDNFEWAEGLEKRFGLIHVDYASGQRTLKASGHWYSRLIASAGASLNE